MEDYEYFQKYFEEKPKNAQQEAYQALLEQIDKEYEREAQIVLKFKSSPEFLAWHEETESKVMKAVERFDKQCLKVPMTAESLDEFNKYKEKIVEAYREKHLQIFERKVAAEMEAPGADARKVYQKYVYKLGLDNIREEHTGDGI
eukprot:TRINITY_DN2913_c0_g1_i1.p1 TRINITY_DN2913_c0_g1~~TRINITY_DN2913_c0_g1_i1.p1  ORF type:complete len:154 (+),score=43.39 TRINITY_DN2913_c0_g1_i1:30-464(+)